MPISFHWSSCLSFFGAYRLRNFNEWWGLSFFFQLQKTSSDILPCVTRPTSEWNNASEGETLYSSFNTFTIFCCIAVKGGCICDVRSIEPVYLFFFWSSFFFFFAVQPVAGSTPIVTLEQQQTLVTAPGGCAGVRISAGVLRIDHAGQQYNQRVYMKMKTRRSFQFRPECSYSYVFRWKCKIDENWKVDGNWKIDEQKGNRRPRARKNNRASSAGKRREKTCTYPV